MSTLAFSFSAVFSCILAAVACMPGGDPPRSPDAETDQPRGQAWWAHIRVLADDSIKGRQTGSDEYLKAAEIYHSTDDDLTQPVDLKAVAQFNAFFADLVQAVADNPSIPRYLDSSFLKRFEACL